MTEKYHCTPLEYDRQPDATIELHRAFIQIEGEKNDLDKHRREQKANVNRKAKLK